MSSSLATLLYTSHLSDAFSTAELGRMVSAARARNAADRITGVLLFDGTWFAQYIEGDAAPTADLLRRLQADPRHERFRILAEEPRFSRRRFEAWDLGYVEVDDAGVLETLSTLPATEALDVFLDLVTRGDFGGGEERIPGAPPSDRQ